MSPGSEIALIACCIVLQGLFSGSEISIVGSDRLVLRARADNGDKAAQRVLKLLENPTRIVGTCLIGTNLSTIAERVSSRCADAVRIHVVVPAAERPSELSWKGSVVLDEDGTLHHHVGCRSEALYLVRPDGYVAFRSQPAVLEKILGYLDTIFA